jgi:hypothetical protein
MPLEPPSDVVFSRNFNFEILIQTRTNMRHLQTRSSSRAFSQRRFGRHRNGARIAQRVDSGVALPEAPPRQPRVGFLDNDEGGRHFNQRCSSAQMSHTNRLPQLSAEGHYVMVEPLLWSPPQPLTGGAVEFQTQRGILQSLRGAGA